MATFKFHVKYEKLEYEDYQSNANELAHSLDSELGGFDVPLMRTREVKKVVAMANKTLHRSTREKNLVSRFGYNDYMAYHYGFMMKVVDASKPESFTKAAKDLQWVEAMND